MHDIDWELLYQYLAGEAAPDERAGFEAWRDALPARQALVAALLEATSEAPALPLFTERDQAETWARLQQTIAGESEVARPVPPRRFVLSNRRRPLVSIAAALALLLGAAAVGGVLRHTRTAATVAAAPAERVLRTARGQRATFQLPDGSRVVLGPVSTLRYTVDYGRRARDVRLVGEAYFSVAHDERRPFTVRAADLVARDLGTKFIVRAYPEDASPAVVVREGEVGIQAATAADATLGVVAGGELGRLSSRGEPVVVAVEMDPYFAWTEGRLVFDGVPLRDALLHMSRWFDLDLRVVDSTLGDIPVTMTLDRRPTADVLGNMAAALGLTYVEQGRAGYFRRPTSAEVD